MKTHAFLRLSAGLFCLALMGGCATTPPPTAATPGTDKPAEITLQAGDQIRVEFPGTPSLQPQSQTIRRDGRITLPLVGDVSAAGKTPSALRTDLLGLYANQLRSNEILVTVVSSRFIVFVQGPVLKPGEVTSDHPLTALEAIMNAGGFEYDKANLRKIMIIHHQPGAAAYTYDTLDLSPVMEGKDATAFYLRQGDIVVVPAKFSWF